MGIERIRRTISGMAPLGAVSTSAIKPAEASAREISARSESVEGRHISQAISVRLRRVGVGWTVAPPARLAGRKVRAPSGRVPGNAWGARAHGKCHRKDTADPGDAGLPALPGGKGEMVR